MIKTRCPFCNAKLSFSESDLGMIVQCPKCNNTFKAQMPQSFSVSQAPQRSFINKYIFGKMYYFLAFFVAVCSLGWGIYNIFSDYSMRRYMLTTSEYNLDTDQYKEIIALQNSVEEMYNITALMLKDKDSGVVRTKFFGRKNNGAQNGSLQNEKGFSIPADLLNSGTSFNTELSYKEDIEESIAELVNAKIRVERLKKIFVSTLTKQLMTLHMLKDKYNVQIPSSYRRSRGIIVNKKSGENIYVASHIDKAKNSIEEQNNVIDKMKIDDLFAYETRVQNDMNTLVSHLLYITNHLFVNKSTHFIEGKKYLSEMKLSDADIEKMKKRELIEEYFNFFDRRINVLSQNWVIDKQISALESKLKARLQRYENIEKSKTKLWKEFAEKTVETAFISVLLAFFSIVSGDVLRAFFHIADYVVWKENA